MGQQILLSTKMSDISAGSPTSNYGSGTTNRVGWHISSAGYRRRILVEFDLSSLVPQQESEIVQARLRLSFRGDLNNHSDAALNLAVHRITGAWVETQVTWNKRNSTTNWNAAGGDFGATAEVVLSSPDNPSGWGTDYYDITALLKDWMAGRQSNCGVLLKCEDESGTKWSIYESDDSTQPDGYKPALIVDYASSEKSATDAGVGMEGASNVRQIVAGSDLGAGTEAGASLEVTSSRVDSAAGDDRADLLHSMSLSDSAAGNDQANAEELQFHLSGDEGLGEDAAAVPAGFYPGADGAVATEERAAVLGTAYGSDAACALERAKRLLVLEKQIIACEIDANLDDLSDDLTLRYVEYDPERPLTPQAQSWYHVDEGDFVQVRLGLAGLGVEDYGTFQVVRSGTRRTQGMATIEIRGRDESYALIESRGRASYGFGAYASATLGAGAWSGPGGWDDDASDPTPTNPYETESHPYAASIAAALCGRVGLGLVWEAPNYRISGFTISATETASQVISRLLEPLQVTRRYRTDMWVRNGQLIVRQRYYLPAVGSLDCRLGAITGQDREFQRRCGAISVYGGTYVRSWQQVWSDNRRETKDSSDQPSAEVATHSDDPGYQMTETSLRQDDGAWVTKTREETYSEYQDVCGEEGNWIGRVLTRQDVYSYTNLDSENPSGRRKELNLGYDEAWRVVLQEEIHSAQVIDNGRAIWRRQKHTLTRYEQFTPTQTRTVVEEYQVLTDGTERMANGYPKAEVRTGVLQSAVSVAPAADRDYKQDDDGQGAEQIHFVPVTDRYEASAFGGGSVEREYSNASLMSQGICSNIASCLAAESGKWLHTLSLDWPRPFPYRKGDRVILTHLPDEQPDLDAIIVGLRTEFNREESRWVHSIRLEAWTDE
ncbi:MAG: DNRLRE domain-containing protein [Armatimonadota bacterium]